MSRTRTVFPSSKIAHIWAHEQADYARNPQGNFYCNGKTIYSYRDTFPIATIVVVPRGEHKGEKIVLFTTDSYGPTTAGHMNDARRAIPNYPLVYCFNVTGTPADVRAELTTKMRDAFADFKDPNIKRHWTEAVRKKNKNQRLLAYRAFLEAADRLREFSELFSYKCEIKLADNHDEIMVALAEYDRAVEARRAVRDAARQRRWEQRDAEWRAQREAEEATRQMKMEERVALWRKGGPVARHYLPESPTLLRVKDDLIETSMGVDFPISHALRVLSVVEALLVKGKTYVANGHTIHLGRYQLDRIDSDGTVHAGCHHIPKDEVLRLIEELKARTPAA